MQSGRQSEAHSIAWHNFIPITNVAIGQSFCYYYYERIQMIKKSKRRTNNNDTMTYSYTHTHTVIELSCFNQNNIHRQLACILVFKVIRRIFHFQYVLPVKSMRASSDTERENEKILVVFFRVSKTLSWLTYTNVFRADLFRFFFRVCVIYSYWY